jgi:hypothetical protein
MSRNEEDSTDRNLGKLRTDAIDCAERLLQQLQADQADLLQWRQRRHITAIEIESGLSTLANAIDATQRVRAKMNGG